METTPPGDQAQRSPLPEEFAAELATLVKSPPPGDRWLHEIKFDGYRIGCRIDRGEVRLLSRRGNDWTDRFPFVVAKAKRLPVRQALLDGEVAVLMPDGRTSFQALQNLLSGLESGQLVYFVFDLLHLDGENVARLPLDARKRRLEKLLSGLPADGLIRYTVHWTGNGPLVHREACRLGFEGIVSKRRDLPYRPGRHGEWVKAKCTRRQELVIGGFTDPEGKRHGIGALLVGYYDAKGRLQFAGKVGTGFTERSAADLRTRLDALEQKTSPFAAGPTGWLGRNAHWVRPELVAEVEFAEWTRDGKVRHSSYEGLREDKPAREVRREEIPVAEGAPREPRAAMEQRPVLAPRSGRAAQPDAVVAGVAISHPQRVIFPDSGITKLDLARYYEAVADWILPHLEGRPLTLLHCPENIESRCHFLKHVKSWAPTSIRRVHLRERHKTGEYLIADSLPALVSLVQMGIVELHTWNARAGAIEQPDRIVIDLDPGPEVAWPAVIDAALLVRAAFEALGLRAFVKNTGGSGLHVVVPIVAERDWSECLELSRRLASFIARQRPELYTTALPKPGREKKILIDYLRNNRTNTSVAAYSVRARPRAPVSTPVRWEELSADLPPDYFTVANLPRRLATLKADPWSDYWRGEQRLEDWMMRTAGAL
ncbi:MAG: DNA ligase D [Myxococcales bacterium]|jgi:bifunctional non-homologous end joining protein LigD